ncbi:hypothetical protein Pcinc_034993, partial [Petrolisthes cinctipes]
VCVTCVTSLHRDASSRPTPLQQQQQQQSPPIRCPPARHRHPPPPTSPLARLISASRTTSHSSSRSGGSGRRSEDEGVVRVKCPLCRVSTVVPTNPEALQTNFYLRLLYRSPSQQQQQPPPQLARLVLWCESCGIVAAPSCSRHNLQPLPDKLYGLQKELKRRAKEGTEWAEGREVECGRQAEVYRWVGVVLLDAHNTVQAALTQAQHAQQRFHAHAQQARNAVERGKCLVEQQEPAEEVVRQLVEEVEGVNTQREALTEELSSLVLATSFHLQSAPPAPPGYQRARISLHFTDAPVLSFSGEERQKEEKEQKGVLGLSEGMTGRSGRSQSVTDPQREKSTPEKVRRSRSLHQTKPRTPQLPLAARTHTSDTSPKPLRTQTQQKTQENRSLSTCRHQEAPPSNPHHQQSPVQSPTPVPYHHHQQSPVQSPTPVPHHHHQQSPVQSPTPVPHHHQPPSPVPEKPDILPSRAVGQDEGGHQQGRRHRMRSSTRHLQHRTRPGHHGRPRHSRCVVM